MKSEEMKAHRRWQGAWPAMLLFLAGTQDAAQGQDAPLHVMRSATLERPCWSWPPTRPRTPEVYVDEVRSRVAIEDGTRVYQAFHRGTTRALDA